MDIDHIKEPANKLICHGPEVIANIRKEYNLDKKEDREKAIAIIYEWIKEQDHIVVKEFPKSVIDKALITCNGSIERAKKQIDTICTFRTLMPQYFQTINYKECDIYNFVEIGIFGTMPKLTKDYNRVVLIRLFPGVTLQGKHYTLFYKLLILLAEYFKMYDYCKGYIFICDIFDINVTDVIAGINLIQLQQSVRILTEGYGCHVKGIYLVTASKLIETFIKMVKPLFSEKIGKRIHAVTTRKEVQGLINSDNNLPEEYGGCEITVKELSDRLLDSLGSKEMQEMLAKMNKCVTDESKRRTDKFNEEYMGVSGSFRTLSLD